MKDEKKRKKKRSKVWSDLLAIHWQQRGSVASQQMHLELLKLVVGTHLSVDCQGCRTMIPTSLGT